MSIAVWAASLSGFVLHRFFRDNVRPSGNLVAGARLCARIGVLGRDASFVYTVVTETI